MNVQWHIIKFENRKKLCKGTILPAVCAKEHKNEEVRELVHWDKTFINVQLGIKFKDSRKLCQGTISPVVCVKGHKNGRNYGTRP